MDVCVNEVTPTVFCDEEGYDIIPVHMVRVLHEETKQEDDEQETITTTIEPWDLKLIEEISICDKDPTNESSNDEADHQEHVYYDASDELEEYEEPEPIVVQLRDGKEVTIPRESTEFQKKKKRRQRQTRTQGVEICSGIPWETTLSKVFTS